MLIANEEQLKYMVGGLLYAPAVHKTIVRNIDAGVYGEITAVAFCLEDTIRDAALPMAEEALRETLLEAAKIPEERRPAFAASGRHCSNSIVVNKKTPVKKHSGAWVKPKVVC